MIILYNLYSYQHRENQSAELLISDALKLIQESLFVTNDRKQDRMDKYMSSKKNQKKFLNVSNAIKIIQIKEIQAS